MSATGDLLEVVEYRRTAEPRGAWAAAGVAQSFEVRLRAHAWRGRAMAAALEAFAKVSEAAARRMFVSGP